MQIPTTFLDAVLPSCGTRVFDLIFPGAPGQRATWQVDVLQGAPVADIERQVTWALQRQADAYVAIAGYGPAQRPIKNGKNAGQLVCARRADNALWHRCLRIDVDVYNGPDPVKLASTPYRSKAAGWHALKAAIKALSLPVPLLVDSGYGIHCYWLFDRDIELTRWLPLTAQLGAALAHHGLVVDTTTTQDAARILRVPGTFNFKDPNNPQPVTQLTAGEERDPAWFEQALQGYQAVTTAAPIAGHRPAGMPVHASPLSANLHPPYSMRGVLKTCPGMSARFQTKGAQDAEPLWHAVLTLVAASDDPADVKERVARHLSSGHSAYDPAVFDAKWAQVEAQQYDPPTCETMARLGMAECQQCPLRYTHKAPSVTGRYQTRVLASTAAVPVPPPVAPPPAALVNAPPPPSAQQLGLAPAGAAQQIGCFLVTAGVSSVSVVDGQLTSRLTVHNGIPSILKQDPAPTPGGQPPPPLVIPIGSYQMISAERLLDVAGRGALTTVTFNRHTDGLARVEIDHRAMTDARSFATLLAGAGMHYNSQQIKDLQDKFMPEFLSQLQRLRQASAIASRCGWTEDLQRFVLGTHMYSAQGVESIRPSTAVTEIEAYHQEGDEASWLRAFNRVIAGGHDRAAIVALGIAAPLMAFTGVDGVLLNAYSPESGVGKSTLCDAILSIWGKPDTLRKDFRDSPAATFHLASVSGNMPMVIDEFTNVEGKELSNYVYTITQGRERHRLSSEAKLRDNNHRWCLPAIATSNTSVHAKLQNFRQDATAEAARVFEMRLYPLTIDPAQMGAAKAEIGLLKTHYGFLGPKLAQLFVDKGADFWRRVVLERMAWWDQVMAHDTGDRFRTVVAALIDIGAGIGKLFGLPFDRAAIVDAVQQHWKTQTAEFELGRTKPEDFVTQYVTEKINGFAVFGGPSGDSLIVPPANVYVGEIRGTSVGSKLQVHEVCVPLSLMRDFIVARNGDYKAVLDWMRVTVRAKGRVRRIARMSFLRGTPRSFRVDGIEFTAELLGQPVLNLTQSNNVVAIAATP